MNKKLVGLVSIALLAGPTLANATQESFHFFSASAGGLSADFTVDVVGGLALNGTGSLSSTSFSGAYTLSLVTASTSPVPGGSGQINASPSVPSYGLGSGFTWQNMHGTGGANFSVDAVVNATPNYLDDYGLAFAVYDSSSNMVGAFNPWANTNTAGSAYATNLILSPNGSGTYIAYITENSGNGTLTVSAVPEPESYAMLLAGLGLVCLAGRRRQRVTS
jgi:hypothetical protein